MVSRTRCSRGSCTLLVSKDNLSRPVTTTATKLFGSHHIETHSYPSEKLSHYPTENVFLYGLGLSPTVTPVADVCGKERPYKLYGAARGLEPLWQLVLDALSGTRLLHYCKNLAVLGGNDPHSYGVTSRRASMNTLRPEFTICKHTTHLLYVLYHLGNLTVRQCVYI